MKTTLKTLIFLTLCMLAAVILLPGFRGGQAAPAEPQSIPTQPHQVFGLATVDGVHFVPEGTPVSAWCGGIKVAEELTFDYSGETWYSLDVPADDPNTLGKDGCVSNEPINFKIANFTAEHTPLNWVEGGYTRLDLNATSTPPDPHHISGVVRVNGAFIPQGIVISAWCGGVQYTEGVVNSQSHYSLNVPGDDLGTGNKEGCIEGETIQFKIGSLTAVETLPWHGGQTSSLDLSAESEPPGNYQVFGQVWANDELVPQGIRISAWCDGVKIVEAVTSSEAYYTMQVPGDDPFTPDIEGCGEGVLIHFMIGNLEADQTAIWVKTESPVRLDLTAEGTIGFNIFLPLILK